MGPGSQKAKNTIGPDLKSFLGMRLSGLNSNIDHQFPGHFWIITKESKMIQLAGCAAVRVLQFPSCLMSLTNEFYRYPTAQCRTDTAVFEQRTVYLVLSVMILQYHTAN